MREEMLDLDISKGPVTACTVTQGSEYSVALKINIVESGEPIEGPFEGMTIHVESPSGTQTTPSGTIAENVLTVVLSGSETSEVGIHKIEIHIDTLDYTFVTPHVFYYVSQSLDLPSPA